MRFKCSQCGSVIEVEADAAPPDKCPVCQTDMRTLAEVRATFESHSPLTSDATTPPLAGDATNAAAPLLGPPVSPPVSPVVGPTAAPADPEAPRPARPEPELPAWAREPRRPAVERRRGPFASLFRDPDDDSPRDDTRNPAPTREPPSLEGTTPPWEFRRQLGIFRAFTMTTRFVAREPGIFFDGQRADEGTGVALFGTTVWLVGILLSTLSAAVSFADPEAQAIIVEMIEEAGVFHAPDAAMIGRFALGMVLLSPLFAFIMPHFIAGLLHAHLMALGGNKRGFSATFRAASYGSVPALLLPIPLLGAPLAIIALLLLQSTALTRIHGIENWRATVVVALAWFAGIHLFSFTIAGLFFLLTGTASLG